MHNSLRWKLLVWYTGMVTVMAIAFGVLTVLSFRQALENEVVRGLFKLAQQLALVMETEDDGRFNVVLTRQLIDAFATDYPTGPYYRIWSANRQVVDYSSSEIPDEFPISSSRKRDNDRLEVVVAGPAGSKILVGRSIVSENSQVRQLMLNCTGVAVLLLSLMLAGGGAADWPCSAADRENYHRSCKYDRRQ